ncbi:toxin-antitoxin system PIN domain toxin [Pseudonocardia eucalypti]|uniref:TA system VapC family ribonuclease toxin n=1 Tax=Pseudonocardia eucalypti TaxID=648755 RepID=UPI0017F63DC0|nr:toxin-antitoxin system PIN domain toxin [Pseudonocardia eucalypti]
MGVWLSAIWGRHVHHPAVATWMDRQREGLVMCRVTQMSLLRLLSNKAVMGGDVLERSEAWRVLDRLRADERVLWAEEPVRLEQVWRALSARNDASHQLWTDDYLAAFAQVAGLELVTLDRAAAGRHPSVRVACLGTE